MAIPEIYHYFIQRVKSANKNLESYYQDPQLEFLHQFRVELKKIRAVFLLLEEIKKDKKIRKWHRQIKDIFRKAGEIRELQIEMSWLFKHRKFNLLRLMRHVTAIKKVDKNFHQNIPFMLTTLKKICRKVEKRLPRLTKQQTEQYISKKWQLVLKHLLSNIEKDQWHETRKGIKQLVYARNWIGYETKLQEKVMLIFRSLDRLQNAIGTWHDLDLFAIRLHHFRGKMKGHVILQREQQLALKKLDSEKEKMEKDIGEKLNKLKILIWDYK